MSFKPLDTPKIQHIQDSLSCQVAEKTVALFTRTCAKGASRVARVCSGLLAA